MSYLQMGLKINSGSLYLLCTRVCLTTHSDLLCRPWNSVAL